MMVVLIKPIPVQRGQKKKIESYQECSSAVHPGVCGVMMGGSAREASAKK
jgi:hypothetical protein